MKDDFLGTFIGSQPRSKILRVFIFNQTEPFTAQLAAKRAGVTVASAEKEIKTLEKIGVIKRSKTISIKLANGSKREVQGKGKLKTWIIDQNFKHLRAISGFVHEVSPIRFDTIVGALRRTGKVSAVILSGAFMGDESRPADLVVALDSLNERRLESVIKKLEPTFGREIRYAAFSTPEFRYRLTIQDKLIRDTLDFPHVVLLDKTRML